MRLPFTVEQFLGVFEKYNLAIWPMHVVVYVLAILAIILAIKKNTFSNRTISAVLSFFWLWMGIVYHWIFFSEINKAAYLFGLLFVIQGIAFLIFGVVKEQLSFLIKKNVFTVLGGIFILYAMFLYPILGTLAGHGFPRSPSFGVAPCPVTIFTFGILLCTDKKVAKYFYIIPLLWSLIGFSAALKLGITEDIGLLIAGIFGSILLWHRDRK